MLKEWLNKWIDEHDLGGITVGEIKSEFAAMESRLEGRDMAARILALLADQAKEGEPSREEIGEKVKEAILEWWHADVPYDNELTERILDIIIPAPAASEALREAIRARMRLYDMQVDPSCIGTGYDATDIITMSELRQLVGFERPGSPRKEGEG